MLKKTLVVFSALIGLLAVVVALQSPEFQVTRSATIEAPASKVFDQINDLQKWNAWSPWARLDPNAKNTFEGPVAGKGAILRWAGNSEVGEGSMTIEESKPAELVRFQLDFLKPFAATHNADFTFKEEGTQTTVTWSMYGKKNFLAKAVDLVMNCEKTVGEQFEKGLENLKTVVEGKPAQ